MPQGPGGRYCNASAARVAGMRADKLSGRLRQDRAEAIQTPPGKALRQGQSSTPIQRTAFSPPAQDATGGSRFVLTLASAMPAITQASATPCAGVGRSPRKAMP